MLLLSLVAAMSDIVKFTGLLDPHKVIIKQFFPSYLATDDKKKRREIAKCAAKRVANEVSITSPSERTKLTNLRDLYLLCDGANTAVCRPSLTSCTIVLCGSRLPISSGMAF